MSEDFVQEKFWIMESICYFVVMRFSTLIIQAQRNQTFIHYDEFFSDEITRHSYWDKQKKYPESAKRYFHSYHKQYKMASCILSKKNNSNLQTQSCHFFIKQPSNLWTVKMQKKCE